MNNLPRITVATVVALEKRFLMVRERAQNKMVYNQPAGHVEVGETLQAAAERETLEETGWQVQIQSVLGVYSYPQSANGIHYLRHCFIAAPEQQLYSQPPDADIESALWLTLEELQGLKAQLRSPMVWRALEDYLAGEAYPLSLLK